MNTKEKVAEFYSKQFKRKEIKRTDESAKTIYITEDEKARDLVRECSNGRLPHDWIFEQVQECLSNICEAFCENNVEPEAVNS